jgi:hypothetical protein
MSSLLSLLNNNFHASIDVNEEEFNQEWMSKMVCPPNVELLEVQVDIYTDAQFELDRLELEEYSRQTPRCDDAIARYNKAFMELEELYADEEDEDEDFEEFDAEKCNQLNKDFPVPFTGYAYYCVEDADEEDADEENEEEEDVEEFDVEKCNQLNKEFPVRHAYYYAQADEEEDDEEEDVEEFDVEKCNQLNKEFPV